MILYDYAPSGNCYKVRLLLAQLGLTYERREIALRMPPDVKAAFVRDVSPLGRVPALRLDGGEVLGESNAILSYLAEGSKLVPADRLGRAQVLQWLFWEQYEHEPTVAVVRAWVKYFGVPAGREADVEPLRQKAHAALAVMEQHLATRDWFVGAAYSIADIALYAYTHVAEEGEIALGGYPAIARWMKRVASVDGHVPITA